jgi:hypothetical protein
MKSIRNYPKFNHLRSDVCVELTKQALQASSRWRSSARLMRHECGWRFGWEVLSPDPIIAADGMQQI